MEVYLRSAAGKYLCAESGPVTAAPDQAQYHSLLMLEPFDPVTRRSAADPALRSQGLVTLRTPEGNLLIPEPIGTGYQLVMGDAARSAAPQIGYDVYRIFKVGGAKDEPIQYGDPVVLRFTPQGQPDASYWLSAAPSGAVTFSEAQRPGEAETFTPLLPVDIVDFMASYNDIVNAITGEVVFSGPVLPGGHTILIDSPDGAEMVAPAQIAITENRTFRLPLTDAAMQLSPCQPRDITLRATYPASGEVLEETVHLEGDRAGFLTLQVAGIRKVKSVVPIFGGASIEVHALLSLDPSAQRLPEGAFPLKLRLGTDSPLIKNLTQDSDHVTFQRPIKVTFQVQQPAEDSPPACAVITARYKIGSRARASQFAAVIRHRGIALDPQR